MCPLRRCLHVLETDPALQELSQAGGAGGDAQMRALAAADHFVGDPSQTDPVLRLLGPVQPEDCDDALGRVRPAPLSCERARYERWDAAFGSG